MNIYEQILLNYGGYILLLTRNICEQNELYENCIEINEVFVKHDINPNMTAEDWVAEFWKMGRSGQTAVDNAPSYFLDAMQMCMDNGVFGKTLIET